jgi:hypothetical protein
VSATDAFGVTLDLTGAPDPGEPPAVRTPMHWKDEELRYAADLARQYPGSWVFVSSAPEARPDDPRWTREVTGGDRQVLGGLAERWDATVLRLVLRGSCRVLVERADPPLAAGEPVSSCRFIAFLGVRS